MITRMNVVTQPNASQVRVKLDAKILEVNVIQPQIVVMKARLLLNSHVKMGRALVRLIVVH